MAGHSKFKNIQHRKGAQDKKRAKVFTKLIRDITIAAKSGAPDPHHNPRLRSAIIAARAVNLPKDKIDKALSDASNPALKDNYEEIRYEGFFSGGIAIIVEALTDNRNRTASEVRATFSKHGGNLGETGSVSFMFNKLGFIIFEQGTISFEAIFEDAIEAGASDLEHEGEHYIVFTAVEQYSQVLEKLSEKYGTPIESYIGWKPHNTINVEGIGAEKLQKALDALEDLEDVQQVFGNYAFA